MTEQSCDEKWKNLKKELKSEVLSDVEDCDSISLITLIGDVSLKKVAYSVSGQKMLKIIADMITTTSSGFGMLDFPRFANKLGFTDEEAKLLDSHKDSATSCMFLRLSKTDTTMAEILSTLRERKDILYRIQPILEEFVREIKEERQPKKEWQMSVLMTYASDGRDAAQRVSRLFRSLDIGVLLIEEHLHLLYDSPSETICKWFSQVDYIIPIVTRNYMKSIVANRSSVSDANYCRSIYALMNAEYLMNQSLNRRVRPLMGAQLRVSPHTLMRHPLLQLAMPEDKAQLIAETLLQNKTRESLQI